MQIKVFERNLVASLVLLTVEIKGKMVLHNNLLIVLYALGEKLALLILLVDVTLPKEVYISCLLGYSCQFIC